jgi:hypothetical protein
MTIASQITEVFHFLEIKIPANLINIVPIIIKILFNEGIVRIIVIKFTIRTKIIITLLELNNFIYRSWRFSINERITFSYLNFKV